MLHSVEIDIETFLKVFEAHMLDDLVTGLDLDFLVETLEMCEFCDLPDEFVRPLGRVQGLKLDDLVTSLSHKQIDRGVSEVAEEGDFVLDGETVAGELLQEAMLF